jgi:MFS family permease
MFVLLPYFLLHTLHDAKFYVGLLSAAGGVSGAIGAVIAAGKSQPKRRIRLTWIYWSIISLSALIIGFVTNFWEVIIMPIVASPMIILGNTIWESMMQTEVPRELLGRVSSVDWFLSLGISPLALVLAGEIANYIGVRTYFVVLGIVCLVPGLLIIASKRINEIDAPRLTPALVEEH